MVRQTFTFVKKKKIVAFFPNIGLLPKTAGSPDVKVFGINHN